jgi:hypothetical protein
VARGRADDERSPSRPCVHTSGSSRPRGEDAGSAPAWATGWIARSIASGEWNTCRSIIRSRSSSPSMSNAA